MLGMGQIAIVRHLALAKREPIRSVARRLGLSRNTVRKYVRQGTEQSEDRVAGRGRRRRRPVRDVVGPRIDQLLAEWAEQTTAKQRITGSRVHAQLVAEGFSVGTTTVRAHLRARRRQAAEVFIPLEHRPGEAAQVDFFAVTVTVGGERRGVHMLQVSLPYSDVDFAWLYEREDLPAFLDGHVRALAYFGGVPKRMVYDNAKVAVERLKNGTRRPGGHFERLVAAYAFEAVFARVATGHDKGGIEVRGKRTRLSALVPIPAGETLEAINAALLGRLSARDPAGSPAGPRRAARLAEERERFIPLPAAAFDPRVPAAVTLSRSSTVALGGARYSVPSRWKGRSVVAFVGATDVRFGCEEESLTLPRIASGERAIRYLHYLPELGQRPQAVRQVAEALRLELGEPWTTLWQRLIAVHGPQRAARVIADLLALDPVYAHRHDALLGAVLAATGHAEATDTEPLSRVPVPSSLAMHQVEAADPAAYDALMQEAAR